MSEPLHEDETTAAVRRARAQLRAAGVEPRSAYAKERLRRRLLQLAERAPQDIWAHAKLLWRDSEDRPIDLQHHRHLMEWRRMAHYVDHYRWVAIVAPTGYMKSTFWSMIYPSWEIGRTKGRVRIGVIGNTHTLAVGFSQAIQKVIESPRWRMAYPDVRPDYDTQWTDASWYVTGSAGPPNPTLLATGIGSQQVLGKRFDLVILDDPTTWEQARSPAHMEAQRRFLRTALLQRFPADDRPPHGKKSRMVVPMTRYGVADLVPTLKELGFTIITMPARGYWDRIELPDGKVVWGSEPLAPAVQDADTLQAIADWDPLIFALLYQGDATAGTGGSMFDPANFQRGDCPYDKMRGVTCYVDTAGGKDMAKGDYFVMAALGMEEMPPGTSEQRGWVIDIDRDRYHTLKQQDQLVANAEKLHNMGCPAQMIVIEDVNEGINLYQWAVANTRLPLRSYTPEGDKQWRANSLGNAYRLRMIWHNRARWNHSYEAELEAFPLSGHDDQVDAAAGAWNHMDKPGPRLRVLRGSR